MLKRSVLLMLTVTLFLLWGCKDNGTDPKPDPLEVSFQVTHVSEYDGSDGAISLTVAGGTSPYTYSWYNGVNTKDIVNLTAGIYKVTITDAKDESIVDSIEVTQPKTSTVTDIDGNVYRTVLIGNQWWMAENLKVTYDPQGNDITSCYYNDDPANLNTYGCLYTWDAAMNGSINAGAQGIAPDGWHIPSVSDWETLIDCLGGEAEAGGKMKESGTAHWNSPNVGATNSSGMNILPAGEKDGSYKFLGRAAVIWTSSRSGTTQARYYTLDHSETQIVLRTWNKSLSYAVRCVKNN